MHTSNKSDDWMVAHPVESLEICNIRSHSFHIIFELSFLNWKCGIGEEAISKTSVEV